MPMGGRKTYLKELEELNLDIADQKIRSKKERRHNLFYDHCLPSATGITWLVILVGFGLEEKSHLLIKATIKEPKTVIIATIMAILEFDLSCAIWIDLTI